MARKYKTTGCARIFIVLLIVAPLAFFAASYINGSDPMDTLRGLFGSEEETSVSMRHEDRPDKESTTDLQDELRRLQKDVDYYKVEAETYKKLLDECQDARIKN
ncbi:hypothetical protein KUV50_08960 [Membranicola marinus]|uniref:Uncharacterized protein n=1 Tax=Membranihabitans marinus TaxID=1227546 RepID=A0A953LA28_9BACT|nr:hypothetical protein [Membranihabitans marinus]MBY5958258.1 hypothetical protein [Membranihabitans marinus]